MVGTDMKVTKGKIISGIIIITVISISIYYFNSQIYRHAQYSNAVITKMTRNENRGIYTVCYTYKVNNKTYSQCSDKNLCNNLPVQKIDSLLKGKVFPIVYAKNFPSQSILFLTKNDIGTFTYSYPDSLIKYDSILTCK